MIVFYGNSVLADKVTPADSFFKRFIGLMGTRTLGKGEGLLLNTSAIHCFFMRIPIDAVYISKSMTVLGTETIKPWRIGKRFRGTKYILELNAGAASSVSTGDSISFEY
jgi:uncharacterized membrane protein (UPF0127 family)